MAHLSLLPTADPGSLIIKADVTLLEFTEKGVWSINIAMPTLEKRNIFKTLIGSVISGTFYGDITECDLLLKVVSVDGLEVSFTTTTDPLTIKVRKR